MALTRAVRTIGAAAALVTLAAACGGSSGGDNNAASSSAPSAASSPTAAAPTKSAIKMGVMTSMTGTGGAATKYLPDVVQGWAKWVNASGGLNGHPVTVVVKDTKSDPATAVAAFQALSGTEKVDVLALGDVLSELAVGKQIAASGIPVIGFGYTPIWNQAPNFFATSGVIPLLYQASAQAAAAVGAKGFGSVACAEVPTCSSGAAAYDPAAKAVGVKYNGLITASSTATSYTAECLKLMQKGTDFIEATMASPSTQRLTQSCAQQGFKGYVGIGAGSVVEKDLLKMTGKMAGYMWAWPWWAKSPENDNFNSVMSQYNSGNDYKDANSSAMWAALEVFHKATASLADTSDRAALTDAMYTVKDETLGGMLPKAVTFTKGQPSPNIECSFLFSWVDKKFKTVTNGAAGNGGSGDLASSCFPPKK